MNEQRNVRELPIGHLHLITDMVIQTRYSHAELAELAIEGGADTIQYRSKGTDFRLMMREAGETAEVCRHHGVLFLVNDRVDVAIATGADGVHLGRTDMPLPIARSMLGRGRVIGGTIRSREDLAAAIVDGADYVGLGPVFQTGTKIVAHPPLGLDVVRAIAHGSPIPIIAIAGISRENIRDVLECGVHGVAVIGAIAGAEDVSAAASALATIVRRMWGADDIGISGPLRSLR